MTEYSLPDIDTINGTIHVTLFSEFAGLTVPTVQSLLSLDSLTKKAKVSLDAQEFETLSIKLAEDYSTYDYGFWYKITSGDFRILFTITEIAIIDSTPTSQEVFLLCGKAAPANVKWSEHYLSLTERVRTADVTLISVLSELGDVEIADLVTEIIANEIDTVGGANVVSAVLKVKDIFACLLHASGLNPTYDATDITFHKNGKGMVFIDGSAVEYDFDKLYFATGWNGAFGFGHNPADELNASEPEYWGEIYPNSSVLVSDILKTFGLVMVTDYDVAGERFLIKLKQMWDAETGLMEFSDKEKESTIVTISDLIIQGAQASFFRDPTLFAWYSSVGSNSTVQTGEIPAAAVLDLNFMCPFRILTTGIQAYDATVLYANTTDIAPNDPNPPAITEGKFWNYTTAAYETAFSSTDKKMFQLATGYEFFRLTKQFKQVERVYAGVQTVFGDTSITSLDLLRLTQVNDLLATTNLYANEIEFNFTDSTRRVTFIQQ